MKTPVLLLALAAALPQAASAAEAARHCNAEWLDNALKSAAAPDAAGMSKACEQAVFRYLYSDAPDAAWADAGTKKAWDSGWQQQARILQAVDDLYRRVDPLGRAALDKADAVVADAVKLGVAARTDGAGVDALIPKGRASAAFGKDKAYAVAAPASAPTVAPADLKAALKALLKDAPAAAGQPKTTALGRAPLAFRKAVIELADELAARSARRDLLDKRGVAADVKADFIPGAGVAAWAAVAPVPTTGGAAAISDASAADDKVYRGALAYLTDPKIAAGDDAGAYPAAALSRLDGGLRNLLASRAAAVDAAVDAAKKRLAGRSVAETLAAVDHDLAAKPAKPGTPPDLAADVLAHLAKTKDYQDLNALFEAKSKAAAADPQAKAWLASDEGKAVQQRLETMRADAKATKVSGPGQLQYSVGGSLMATTVRVPSLQNEQYRNHIADAVALAIANNPLEAKVLAALMAFRNQSPAAPVPPDAPVGKLPAPPPPAGPKSAWDAIAQTTPEPHWWNSARGRLESYLSTQNERAAADALAAGQKRQEVQRRADAARDWETRKCEAEKAEIRSRPADPVWKKDVADKWRAGLLAAKETECAGRVQGAFDKVVADAKLTPEAEVTAAAQKRRDEAMAQVKQAYADGIAASVAELRKEYGDPKTSRARGAATESGLGAFYGKHLDFVEGYFKGNWDGDKFKPSADACQGGLWHDARRGPNRTVISSEFKDPSVDNVDSFCVHGGLVGALKGRLGTGDKAD